MFATETIQVLRPIETVNSFGDIDREEYAAEEVAEVLVAAGRASNDGADNPEGKDVDFTFHFPYWYTQSLRDCRILYNEEQFIVIGDPRGLMPENTPTSWNRAVETYLADSEVAYG